MSDHKASLALQRDRQLAVLRAKMDRPERLTLRFACAERDSDYDVSFTRLSATARFTCERIEPVPKAPGLFRGLFRPRGDSLRVPVAEVDFSSVSCAGCGQQSIWIQCSGCGAFVCGSGYKDGMFRCRESCGTSGELVPMTEVCAGRTDTDTKAVGRTGHTALPTSRGAKR